MHATQSLHSTRPRCYLRPSAAGTPGERALPHYRMQVRAMGEAASSPPPSPAPPPANHQSSPIKLAPSDVRALSNLPAAAIKQALLALLDDPSHQLPTNGRQRWSSAPVAMTSASIAAAINADPMTAARPTPKHTPASASLRPSAEEVEEEKDDDEDDKVQRPPSPSKHPELHTGSPSRARRVLAPASAILEDADDEEEDRQSRRTTVELDPSDWSAKAPPGAQMSYDVIEQAGANGYHQQAGAPEGTTPAMLAPTDWPGSRAPSASSVLPDVANGCHTRGVAMAAPPAVTRLRLTRGTHGRRPRTTTSRAAQQAVAATPAPEEGEELREQEQPSSSAWIDNGASGSCCRRLRVTGKLADRAAAAPYAEAEPLHGRAATTRSRHISRSSTRRAGGARRRARIMRT